MNIPILWSLSLLFSLLFLSGCREQAQIPLSPEPVVLKEDQVQHFVARFAPFFHLQEGDVQATDLVSYGNVELSGFMLEHTGMKLKDFDWKGVMELFDGWAFWAEGEEV